MAIRRFLARYRRLRWTTLRTALGRSPSNEKLSLTACADESKRTRRANTKPRNSKVTHPGLCCEASILEHGPSLEIDAHFNLVSELDGGQHGLFVMLENQGQDLNCLTITPDVLSMRAAAGLESWRHFSEGRIVAQRARLALNNRQILPAVVDCCTLAIV